MRSKIGGPKTVNGPSICSRATDDQTGLGLASGAKALVSARTANGNRLATMKPE